MQGDALTPVPQQEAAVMKGGFMTANWVRFLDNLWRRIPRGGTFTLAAAASTVVSDPNILNTSVILLMPTNAAAAALMGSAKALYVSVRTSGAAGGFTVTTANAAAAAGTETFEYLVGRR